MDRCDECVWSLSRKLCHRVYETTLMLACPLRGEQAAWGEKEAEPAPGGCALILTDAPPPTPVLDLRHVCSVGGHRGM